MQLDNNSLIMQWNTDTNGNPVSKHIPREVQQVSPTHNLIQLTQIPDEFYPLRIVTEDNIELREVKYRNEMSEETFRVDYGMGLVYFHESLKGKMVIINYYGRGVMLISDSRIFHKNGDTIVDTWDNILERSQDALDLIEHAGGLANAIKVINQKVDEGTKVADRIENFITETQFYGYTITLSREAFVVKADDNGEVGKTETSSVYTDVLVYKGAKQIIPTLTVSNEYGCTFKVEGQRVKLTSIDVNLIKVNAILNIDCGDGLVAQRVLEVTKVFDGVSQYEVSMTNPFYSFQANSEGYIEESQSIECTFKVSKANIDYENYTVQIQNLPQGLNYEIKKGSIVFTAISGRLLPSYGSCSVVLTIDGQSFNKPFTWNKVKQGQDAKSLTLVGNQIIRYEQPDFSDIPLYSKVTVSAKVVGLSGTPTWSFYNGVEWVVLENETALDLTFTHNDELIWADRKEVTIKCQMEEFHDELTIVKLASGVNGNDAITVVLTNESHTVSIDDSGFVATAEIENTRTNVLAYKGANSVTPKITRGNCVGCDVSIAGNTVQLLSLDNSFTSSTAELLVDVDGVIITKIWTISKSKQGLQGENGQNGKTYILNVTGGTRSVAYSQINHDPRPAYSFAFTGSLYENGIEILEDVSWYWVANGHFEGSSVTKRFTPTIKKVFDETVINNSISVMATYNGQTLTQDIPLSVTKDAYGLDWVSEWDSTKVDVRGSLILTPKIFAGHYDQENDLITGVAIGKDVLNNGRTVGVVGYQNNVPSFLLDTDGSLQVGNPFGEDSTGLYYNEGMFKLKVNELSIEGAKVPTENEIGNLVASEINSAKNELQETINGLNNSLGSLEDVVNNSLQDGILTEVEKHSLKTVIDTINGEVNTVVAQSNSILINPYLSNTALMLKLEELLGNYEATHNTLVETYVRITNSDIPTDEDIALFNTTLSDLRVISDELNQVLIDCLTNISQTQAQQLVNKAKEEIQAEVSDVNDALSDLENTINTDFKAGLVTSINIANLENHLRQLAKEKADLDAQYNVIYNNTKLSNSIKSKLLQAKSDYDIAHDTLVAKIETSIADNLMTEAELQEINRLITVYTQKLATYSGVAQESNADIALNSAQAVVEALDQEAIFNKLTNNGEVQGIYLENSKLYINGEYIKAKSISGDKISAGVITATNGKSTINLDNGAMNLGNTTDASYLQWTGSDLNIKAKSLSIGATSVATTTDVNNATSGKVDKNQIISSINQTAEAVKINANKIELTGEVVANAINGGSTTINGSKITTGTITANQINTKTLTADMITSGTFKGTSFLAGGSTNGEGYIQVLDASNSIKMIASKNGIFATSIQFPESITISGAVKTNGVIEANGTGFHSSFRETGTNYTINYQAQLIEGALSVTQESDFGGSSSLSTIKITGNRININGVLLQNKGANLQLNCPLRIVGSGSVDKRVATVTSLGTVYLGDETTDTSVLSKNAPNWWNGSTFRELLHAGGGQTISGGNLGISAGGLNVGTGTNTEGYTISNNRNINNVHHRASLSVYNTDNGIASLFYRNMSTSIEKGVGVKASSSTSGYFIPSHNNQLSCGTASYKWTYIYATNGTIQTSDERFKIKRGYADTNDCYDMVKNTQLYNYTMLGENKENLSQNRLGKLAMARNEDETNVHIGVMAQDLQNYGCGKKILVEGEYEKQDGTKDTMLHINPLDMSMAILGGLQKEIQIRDEQYEELKQENETLKNELAEIKRMLMAQTLI